MMQDIDLENAKTSERSADQGPALHVAVPVWGDEYIQIFLQYSLPTILATGNIGAIAQKPGGKFRIFTTGKDSEVIKSSPAFQQLTSVVEYEIIYIEQMIERAGPELGAKHDIKSNIYRQSMSDAFEADTAVAMVNSDMILAKGFFQEALNLLARGFRTIEVPGPRASARALKIELDQIREVNNGQDISISAKDLARIWYNNIHPLLEMHFVQGYRNQPFHPSHLYWDVQGEGVIMRCFDLYPIVVYPKKSQVDFSTTIDSDLVDNMALTPHETCVVQDSRKMFCCEMSSESHYVGQITTRGDYAGTLNFYRTYDSKPIERILREIHVYVTEPTQQLWRKMSRESRNWSEDLIQRFRT